jgi:hypothetical protein
LLLVEANRARKIVRAEASFNDSVNSRAGHSRIPGQAEREIPLRVWRGPFRGRNGNIWARVTTEGRYSSGKRNGWIRAVRLILLKSFMAL